MLGSRRPIVPRPPDGSTVPAPAKSAPVPTHSQTVDIVPHSRHTNTTNPAESLLESPTHDQSRVQVPASRQDFRSDEHIDRLPNDTPQTRHDDRAENGLDYKSHSIEPPILHNG